MTVTRQSKRWEQPLGGSVLRSEIVDAVLLLPLFKIIEDAGFPAGLSPAEIIANDGRVIELSRGDIVFSKGDYGSSIFVVLLGSMSRMLPAAQPAPAKTANTDWALSWSDVSTLGRRARQYLAARRSKIAQQEPDTVEDPLAAAAKLEHLGPNSAFGIASALTRTARRSTAIAAEDNTLLLELRWPGLRDLRYWSESFDAAIGNIYRARAIDATLRAFPLFADLDEATLDGIARQTTFEIYGDTLWSHDFQRQHREPSAENEMLKQEPVIAAQGHYLDDLILVHSGFARQTRSVDHGEMNLALLSAGDAFGLEQIAESAASNAPCKLSSSLRAVGYADIVRIPTPVIDVALQQQLPQQAPHNAPYRNQAALDFALDHRLTNGTQAMVINLDRCVNCDDCVRACAATHGDVARFTRRGKVLQNVLVANACMHCIDPVCLIDCPTDAIHRDRKSGAVVIDEAACIGCSACAAACPYDNIRMEPMLDDRARPIIRDSGERVWHAVKCDLCNSRKTGPACVEACPHDALTRMAPILLDDFLIPEMQ